MSPRLDRDPIDSPEPAGEFDAVSPVDPRLAGALPGFSLGLGFGPLELGVGFRPLRFFGLAEDGLVKNCVFQGVHDRLLACLLPRGRDQTGTPQDQADPEWWRWSV